MLEKLVRRCVHTFIDARILVASKDYSSSNMRIFGHAKGLGMVGRRSYKTIF